MARYTAWHRSWALKILFGLGCLLLLAGMGNLFSGMGSNAVTPFLLGLAWIAYAILSPRLSIRRQLRASGHVSEEGTYEFDEEKFTVARPSVQLSMPWSAVHSAIEMKDVFAIFTTKTCFFVLPKRFFPADDISHFRDLIDGALRKSGKQLIPVGRS